MDNSHQTAAWLMPQVVEHHKTVCRWGKYMARTGFVLVGLLTLTGISTGIWAESSCYFYRVAGENSTHGYVSAFPLFISVAYLFTALIYFFPSLALYRHARHTDHAVRHDHGSFREERSGSMKANLLMTGILLVIALLLLIFGAGMILSGPVI